MTTQPLRRLLVLSLLLLVVGSTWTLADPLGKIDATVLSRSSGRASLALDREALVRAAVSGGTLKLRGFPVLDATVDLRLSPFRVTGPETQFVVGTRGGRDRSLTGFDPDRLTLLRGTVVGATDDHAYLAIADGFSYARITINGAEHEWLGARSSARDGLTILRPIQHHRDPLPPGVPFCGLDPATSAAPSSQLRSTVPPSGLRRIQLAAETDYELFQRCGGLSETALYVVALYGAVSDIYLRDVGARVELTYVRLWDQPADLFNEPSPHVPFRDYWQTYMTHVPRDVAQLLTGRRDLPYGGISWLGGLCGTYGYSVAGLLSGGLDPSLVAGPGQWDLIVAAHELGHSCGAAHTHDYGLDYCYPLPGAASRGTIMGYCHVQNGGVANTDLRFHAYVGDIMSPFIAAQACVDIDCNRNGFSDTEDVAGGFSTDLNTNGTPDECEDCDGDGALDPAAIAAGDADVDGDGVPDACAADCNANGLPDPYEASIGLAPDANGNHTPDACEADCDDNGVPDFMQINADMELDLDRDGVLDVCSDCDGDGVDDVTALAGAHGLWVIGAGDDRLRAFHPATGALAKITTRPTISAGQDVVIAPNGNVLVASGANWRVVEFDSVTGAFVRNFVPTGSAGLRYPAGLAFGPDGDLYVSSRDTDAIFQYDGTTGEYVRQFVLPSVGGLSRPYGLTFGPDGHLYVASDGANAVLRYDGSDGTYLGEWATPGSGGLSAPRGLAFKPDGNLLVASSGTGQLLEYDRWTGAFVGVFNQPYGTLGTDISAWGVAIGPDRNVYVTLHEPYDGRVLEFDARDGVFLNALIRGPSAGLFDPTGLAFTPGLATDCNRNGVPDNCDIAAGRAADANTNGVPDGCETDCDGNGVWDLAEIIPAGNRFDCNYNGVIDDCDIADGVSTDCNTNGAPDECDLRAGIPVDCGPTCAEPGDMDADGDYDLRDLQQFTICFGADPADAPECICGDLDISGGAIDLTDWIALEAALGGPR